MVGDDGQGAHHAGAFHREFGSQSGKEDDHQKPCKKCVSALLFLH
jgi:hypothetical protein